MTGCPTCDLIQKKTGDKTRLCDKCKIDMHQAAVTENSNRIKEIEQRLKGKENGQD